jgi:hypothetical protein
MTAPTIETLALAYQQALIMLVQHAATPGWLTPPNDGDHLRSALEHAAAVTRARGDEERARKIEQILWQPIEFHNVYECPCGCAWTDTWTAQCDDECPECGKDISPL